MSYYELLTTIAIELLRVTNDFQLLRVTYDKCLRVVTSYLRQMPSSCYKLLTTNAFELLQVTYDKCFRIVTSYLRQLPSSCYELLTTIAFVRAIIAVLWTIASLRFQITLPSTRASQFRRWARDTIYKQSQMQISERQVPKRGKNAAKSEIREGLKRGCAEMRQRLKRGTTKI